MPDPVTVAITIMGAIFGAGATGEVTTRQTSLNVQGQNDITERNCDNLCIQLRTRWNERCLALADEAYMRNRWQQAAIAAAGAAATAAALQYAAGVAASSVFGALAAVFLGAAAVAAAAIAIAAGGFASSALTGYTTASTKANGVRSAFVSAESQMLSTCGADRTNSCRNQLPPCP